MSVGINWLRESRPLCFMRPPWGRSNPRPRRPRQTTENYQRRSFGPASLGSPIRVRRARHIHCADMSLRPLMSEAGAPLCGAAVGLLSSEDSRRAVTSVIRSQRPHAPRDMTRETKALISGKPAGLPPQSCTASPDTFALLAPPDARHSWLSRLARNAGEPDELEGVVRQHGLSGMPGGGRMNESR